MGIRLKITPSRIEFYTIVKILRRRLYSPSLKDVAWIKDTQLIFLIFYTFVCKFGWADKRLDSVRGKKNYRQLYGKKK